MEQDKFSKVLSRLQAQCSRREFCTSDIRAKALKSMEGDAEAADRIVTSLKEDKFVDDLRYASAFAREKASLSGIDRQVVTEALSEVDENAAGRKLESVVAAKYRLLAEDPQCKLKLIRFALGRGYGYDEVKSAVDKVMKGEV